MARKFDAAVVGLGAMGSAALRALSRRGLKVIGIDRFAPPHTLGSSHGFARIIREAYFEHPAYVPLVQRSYLLWDELERESGERLRLETGGLMVGGRDGVLVSGALRSAREHRLQHELIDAAEIGRRIPAFRPDTDMVGVWEPQAGVLFPERAIGAFLASAGRHGATVRLSEPVVSWRMEKAGVELETANGSYRAERLVLAAGAWLPRLLPDLALPLTIERVVQCWLEPAGDAAVLEPPRCPISIWEYEPERFFYAFPLLEEGLKVALHHQGEPADPDRLRREIDPAETAALRALIERYMPDAAGPLKAAMVCMYTNTPDSHFIVDRHPRHPAVLLVSACSGHGFKFAPAIGEVVSDLIVEGETRHNLELFKLGRWTEARAR
jgi:sarcosine oxidase